MTFIIFLRYEKTVVRLGGLNLSRRRNNLISETVLLFIGVGFGLNDFRPSITLEYELIRT